MSGGATFDLASHASLSTIDFFGTDENVDSFEADDLAKPLLFDFDELHLDFDELHLDHVRLDERDEEEYPLFCAASVTGSSNAMGMNAIPIRLRIIKSFLLETDATGLSPFLKGDARELEQDDHPHPAPERASIWECWRAGGTDFRTILSDDKRQERQLTLLIMDGQFGLSAKRFCVITLSWSWKNGQATTSASDQDLEVERIRKPPSGGQKKHQQVRPMKKSNENRTTKESGDWSHAYSHIADCRHCVD